MAENETREEETQETSEEESQEEETQEESEEESQEEESEEEDVDWKERALKAEKAIEQSKRKAKSQKTEPQSQKKDYKSGDDDLRSEVENLKLSERKRQFGYEHNLSPDEVDRVFQITSEPTEKTLEDPFVKSGLQGIRKQKKVSENTPSSSPASPVSSKKFKELGKNEKDAKWQEYMRKKGVVK